LTYLLKRKNHFYYNRNVPSIYRDLDPRGNIRIALNSTCRRIALRKAIALDDEVEAYWQSLLTEGQTHDVVRFGKIVHIARQIGFTYKPIQEVAALPLQELIGRILALQDSTPKQVEAVLGGKEQSDLKLDQTLERYWNLTKDRILDKSPNQIRKWCNPRIKAVENFIAVVGNKRLKDLTRSDTIAFRDWWIERIENENKNPESANKDFIHLKDVLEVVSEHEGIGLDIALLFRKIKLKTSFKQTRLPFITEQIRDILESKKLLNMNEEGRWFLYAAAETGARPTEIVGLLPEDIILGADIPHISIKNRKNRLLKTPHSERVIPLVGYALDAFKAMPNGFPKYRDKPDNMTNAVNKFLRENGLMPSERHSVYSFRHSFQDRILGVNAPDRVQAELMGHKFHRPKYGNGASLELKREWLDKVCVKNCC